MHIINRNYKNELEKAEAAGATKKEINKIMRDWKTALLKYKAEETAFYNGDLWQGILSQLNKKPAEAGPNQEETKGQEQLY